MGAEKGFEYDPESPLQYLHIALTALADVHTGKSTEKSPVFLYGFRSTAAIMAYSLARVMRCVGNLHSPAPFIVLHFLSDGDAATGVKHVWTTTTRIT